MKIIKIQPPVALKNVINEFWYAEVSNSATKVEQYKFFADGAPGIIFQHNNGNSTLFREADPLPIAFLYGQKSGAPCSNFIHGQAQIFGLSFQPTAVKKLFQINTSELTNSLADLRIFLPNNFTEKLFEASSVQHLTALFSKEIFIRLIPLQKQSALEQSIDIIRNNTEKIDSMALAQHCYLSRRQFQRKFKESVGISPETYFRINRFQKSLHLLKSRKHVKLSDIAYQIGYADQSHFGREFKLFSSFTPNEFLKSQCFANDFEIAQNNIFSPLRIIKN